MAENTKIEWADHTLNPWVGCQKVSPGCDLCYAETLAVRFKMAEWGPHGVRRPASERQWRQPALWNLKAQRDGVRRRVFCASMADVFDNQAPPGARERLWQLIADTPLLDWLLLTKRPENIRKMLPSDPGLPSWRDGYPNVWLGISAEDQERYDHRWPILASVPAFNNFVSIEPMIGEIDPFLKLLYPLPDWIIVGGESGPGARPMQADWVRYIAHECHMTDVAFFFKQWGHYRNNPLLTDPGRPVADAREVDPPSNGKGGALLDGKLWRQFPTGQMSPSFAMP